MPDHREGFGFPAMQCGPRCGFSATVKKELEPINGINFSAMSAICP
jgi:hypothetical protein